MVTTRAHYEFLHYGKRLQRDCCSVDEALEEAFTDLELGFAAPLGVHNANGISYGPKEILRLYMVQYGITDPNAPLIYPEPQLPRNLLPH